MAVILLSPPAKVVILSAAKDLWRTSGESPGIHSDLYITSQIVYQMAGRKR
jgi:hypothetical protein